MAKEKKLCAEELINPVRIRIIGYCRAHAPCTAKQIGSDLADVPQASLYRHIRRLLEMGILEIDHETPVRGLVERSYRLAAHAPGEGLSLEGRELLDLFYTLMLTLFGDFARYAERTEDPGRDGVGFTTGIYRLTDAEGAAVAREIGAVLSRYLDREDAPGRRLRRITWITSPIGEEGSMEKSS